MLRRDRLIPPERIQRHERRDFAEAGEADLRFLVELAGLRPTERVLEIGCGAGRLARPLVGFLQGGTYEGLDVDRQAVGWCRRAYRRHRHARFLCADVFDERRHPGGTHRPAAYRFPYDDGDFDLVVALSVLPHLLEEGAARYLAECRRVLRPGGRLVATCFVLDDRSRATVASGEATFSFLDADQHVAVLSEDVPDEAVAFDARWIGERFGGPVEIHPGAWRGGEELRLLDVVVARGA